MFKLMRKYIVPVICMMLALMSGTKAFPAHPLITDDVYTQGKGNSQLELSGEYSYDKDTDKDSTTNSLYGGVVFTHGLIETLDIILTSGYQAVKDNSEGVISRNDGVTDTILDAKWRFYEKKDGLALAVKPGIIFPTGDHDKGLGSGKTGYRFLFISSLKWEPLAVHLNIGYTRNENRIDERKDIFRASLAGEWELSERIKLVADTGIETCRDAVHREDPAFVLLGIIYSVTKKIDLDLGVKQGFTGTETRFTLSGAATFRF